MLNSLLEFDPSRRISAFDALKNDWFDDVRLPEQEIVWQGPEVDLSVDSAVQEELSIAELKKVAFETLKESIHCDFFSEQKEELVESD